MDLVDCSLVGRASEVPALPTEESMRVEELVESVGASERSLDSGDKPTVAPPSYDDVPRTLASQCCLPSCSVHVVLCCGCGAYAGCVVVSCGCLLDRAWCGMLRRFVCWLVSVPRCLLFLRFCSGAPVLSFRTTKPSLLPIPLPIPVATALLRSMLAGLRIGSVAHATSITVLSILRTSIETIDGGCCAWRFCLWGVCTRCVV